MSDNAALERALHAERDRLRDEIAKLVEPTKTDGQQIAFGKRVGEGTNEAISRFTNVGIANDLDDRLGRVTRALEKLAEGSYGICDVCGKPIAPGRLEAAPESVLCIDDARAAR